jgi:hypothetical protein
LGECKYFFFGGCDGNGNNFDKLEDCQRRCGNGAATTPASGPPTAGNPPATLQTTGAPR